MAGAKIKITAADSKFHCTKFVDADVTGIQMKADGTVTANGIDEVKSKNTRFYLLEILLYENEIFKYI